MSALLVPVILILYYIGFYYLAGNFAQQYPFIATVLGIFPWFWIVFGANDFSPGASVIFALMTSTVVCGLSILLFS